MDFDYVGAKAPWRWSDITPEWGVCSTGKRQSPIDISGAKEDRKLKGLKVHYEHDVGTISLKNHTVQVSVEPGSWLDFDGERYDLKRVFFRTPGEHRINGLPYELELQLLHQEIGGRVLMLSVQVTRGKSLPELKRITESLPRYEGETNQIERLTWSSFLPSKKTYWFYKGSETFPPCKEGVSWLVLTSTMTASQQEIDALAKLQKDNVRPTQPLHGRPITRSNR